MSAKLKVVRFDFDRDILPTQMAHIVKMYVEQAITPSGLSVDKLAYSDQIREMVTDVNAKYPERPLAEKDIYNILMFLRKTGKLPKVFRSEHRDEYLGEANA